MSEVYAHFSSPAAKRIWQAGEKYRARHTALESAIAEQRQRTEAARRAEQERRRRQAADRHEIVFGLARSMNITKILEQVCEQRNLGVREVLSDRRADVLVRARHEIWWRCTKETRLSIAEIGRRFHRDHTTIMHGMRMHEKRMGKAA